MCPIWYVCALSERRINVQMPSLLCFVAPRLLCCLPFMRLNGSHMVGELGPHCEAPAVTESSGPQMRPPLDGSGSGSKSWVCGTHTHTHTHTHISKHTNTHRRHTRTHTHTHTLKCDTSRNLIGLLGFEGFSSRWYKKEKETKETGKDRSVVFWHELHKLLGLHKLHKPRIMCQQA